MLESCSLKMTARLSIADKSEALLFVANAIKKIDLVNKFSSEHESVRKSSLANFCKTGATSQLGTNFLVGGRERN